MRSHTELARLAEGQYGVVTFRQLRGLGFSKGAISRSSEADRLGRIHRGVYAVAHARLSRRGRCLAAVLACGSGALLSHESAAFLWGALSWCPTPAEVSVPSRGRQRRGIKLHHAPGVATDERDELDGIPVTSLPRTLLDLAGGGSPRRLQRSIERAERLGLLDVAAIDASLHRHFGRPGTKRVLEAIEIYRDLGFTRSRAELLFLDMRSTPTGSESDSRSKSTDGTRTGREPLSRPTRYGKRISSWPGSIRSGSPPGASKFRDAP
jgi:predicted transcriptional regulator of viral defense system